ncbi:hypothetical protein HC766_03715 [Candidatus Gracilibacteria bacterium]|nr:hypothetical protein [Thermales bacterium]NJL96471.1 hypothetical protein [Candidatus Gracilibacteria bacterium]NJS41448.1 hypothetical protein [Candidatus Gracilibacteria bacterium]
MTSDEFSKDYADRLLESLNPIAEAELIRDELNHLISDYDDELTQEDKDVIVEKLKIMVQEELDRGQTERELDEDAVTEALDLLEKGEI